jgi:hypothetical protein
MKKPRKPRTTRIPRTLDDVALAAAGGGRDGTPVLPWIPDQHNETFVRRL